VQTAPVSKGVALWHCAMGSREVRFLAQNATICWARSTQTRWRVYTVLPYSLAGFKGWAREGGEWEGREGSMIKGEAEGIRKGGG